MFESEKGSVEIVTYEDRFQPAFRDLNAAWISTYFRLEPHDFQQLDNPREQIIDRGGEIFVALFKGEPIGVCALIRTKGEGNVYELAKFAVHPKMQGLGIGDLLCRAVIARARELGGKTIFIDGNTKLHAALHLYRKHGFKEVPMSQTPYARVDIQLELTL